MNGSCRGSSSGRQANGMQRLVRWIYENLLHRRLCGRGRKGTCCTGIHRGHLWSTAAPLARSPWRLRWGCGEAGKVKGRGKGVVGER